MVWHGDCDGNTKLEWDDYPFCYSIWLSECCAPTPGCDSGDGTPPGLSPRESAERISLTSPAHQVTFIRYMSAYIGRHPSTVAGRYWFSVIDYLLR
jgi:hypothetical protein